MSNTNTFEVQAGNGRLYRLDADKTSREKARMAELREKGQAWATDDKIHDYDGFLQIGQAFIDWLQEGLNQSDGDLMRMNWKGKVNKDSGSPVLQISGAWLKGMPNLKEFTESGSRSSAPSAPEPPSAPQAQAAPVDDFLDDDLPF